MRFRLWSPKEAREVFLELAGKCDLLIPSLEEAEILTGLTERESMFNELLSLGPSQVVLKAGDQGAAQERTPTSLTESLSLCLRIFGTVGCALWTRWAGRQDSGSEKPQKMYFREKWPTELHVRGARRLSGRSSHEQACRIRAREAVGRQRVRPFP